MSSAWEQWGAKRPANGALNGAQDAFQSLLRASPLSATVSSSISGENGAYSLKKMWDSARDITKNAVNGVVVAGSPANSTASTVGSTTDLEALESGQMRANGGDASAEDAESATATWPLFRRKSNTENSLLPTMSWNTRFKYFVGMTLMGLMFFGMASIFLPLIMIRPSKFALSFTFGSLCLMSALAMLKGPAAYVASLLEPKRLLLTTAYFLTLAAHARRLCDVGTPRRQRESESIETQALGAAGAQQVACQSDALVVFVERRDVLAAWSGASSII